DIFRRRGEVLLFDVVVAPGLGDGLERGVEDGALSLGREGEATDGVGGVRAIVGAPDLDDVRAVGRQSHESAGSVERERRADRIRGGGGGGGAGARASGGSSPP